MSDLLQIHAPIMPKNYNLTAKPIVQNDTIFDLVDLSKIIKTSDRTEQFKQDNSTFEESNALLPKMSMLIAKDPALAATALRSMLSNDVLTQLAEGGNVELLAKLTEFASEIMLSPENVIGDLKSQQLGSSMFNGDLFNLLRQVLSQTTNPDIKTSILNFLKSAVSSSSGREILNSLSSNLKFLSTQFAPSRKLSEALNTLSLKLLSPNAPEEFPTLKTEIQSLMSELSTSLLLTDKVKSMLPLITYNLSRFNDNNTALKDAFNGILDQLSNKDLKTALTKSFMGFIENSNLPASIKELFIPAPSSPMDKIIADLSTIANAGSKSIDVTALANSLSIINTNNGLTSIKEILMQVLPRPSMEMVTNLLDDFTVTKDLNALLGKLSKILDAIERFDVKIPLAASLNEALGKLAKDEGINYKPPTSMENLVTFLSKNINDGALRSLNPLTQGDMISSMLTAPGVFTPLLHYLVPVQIEDTRAFGELWVDNDTENSNSSNNEDDSNHLFLSFSVESIGDFELEIFTKHTDITILMLCPTNLTKSFTKIKDNISRIASGGGYSIKSTTIEPLLEKRNLIDVFPKIKEKRAGINVKI